jgi:predicted O-methyltransferase YrrM
MSKIDVVPPAIQEQWTTVDRYLNETLIKADAALEAALADSVAAGLPAINVAPNQGKMLHLLARAQKPRKILEIGTLGGYSTIWLARALAPGGKLVTLEIDAKHAAVAQANLKRASLDAVVDLRLGPAVDSLSALAVEGAGPFDFVFIDANKDSIPAYFTWSLALTRPGSVIVVDNVVRKGAVADASSTDPAVLGVRRFNEMVAAEPRVSATTVQTVGSKGWDGFTLVLVLGDH